MKERLDRLRATLEELPRLVASLPPERLELRPADGGWSARTVVAHLADAEQVYGYRMRLVLAEDRPVLTPYDQELWADRFGGVESVEESLDRWRALRLSLLRLLECCGRRSGTGSAGTRSAARSPSAPWPC